MAEEDPNDPVAAASGSGAGAAIARERERKLAEEKEEQERRAAAGQQSKAQQLTPEQKKAQERENELREIRRINAAHALSSVYPVWKSMYDDPNEPADPNAGSLSISKGDADFKIEEGRFHPPYDKGSDVRVKKDGDHFNFSPVPATASYNTFKAGIKNCVNFGMSKGVTGFTVKFNPNKRWGREDVARKHAAKQLIAMISAAKKAGATLNLRDPSVTNLLDSLSSKEFNRLRQAAGVGANPADFAKSVELSLQQNQYRNSFIRGAGTTEEFDRLQKELSENDKMSSEEYQGKVKGLDGKGLEQEFKELEKRASQLDVAKEKLEKGIGQLENYMFKDDGKGGKELKSDEELLAAIQKANKEYAKPHKAKKILAKVKERVNGSDLKKIDNLKQALEAEKQEIEKRMGMLEAAKKEEKATAGAESVDTIVPESDAKAEEKKEEKAEEKKEEKAEEKKEEKAEEKKEDKVEEKAKEKKEELAAGEAAPAADDAAPATPEPAAPTVEAPEQQQSTGGDVSEGVEKRLEDIQKKLKSVSEAVKKADAYQESMKKSAEHKQDHKQSNRPGI